MVWLHGGRSPLPANDPGSSIFCRRHKRALWVPHYLGAFQSQLSRIDKSPLLVPGSVVGGSRCTAIKPLWLGVLVGMLGDNVLATSIYGLFNQASMDTIRDNAVKGVTTAFLFTGIMFTGLAILARRRPGTDGIFNDESASHQEIKH
jgi:hypothetical protein